MKLSEQLEEVIAELDRLHPEGNLAFPGIPWEDGLPNFITTQSGYERHFSKVAQKGLHQLAAMLHADDPEIAKVIERDNFSQIVRKAVADLHADGEFSGGQALPDNMRKLRERLKNDVAQLHTTFTHYFPSWTLGLERESPFVIGPVTLMTREQWLESVDFHESVKDWFLNAKEANHNWKHLVRQALGSGVDSTTDLPGLAGDIYPAIKGQSAIVKITLAGYEKDLSRKVGGLICKSALDSISLAFGGGDFFFKQALGDERMPPVHTNSLLETDGSLWTTGHSTGPRFVHQPPARLQKYAKDNREIFEVFGAILKGLSDPGTVSHPNLCNRWATALEWLSEGSREKNEAVALAKIATSIDVLACGGKYAGILAMLGHLTGWKEDTVIVKSQSPETLKAVVKMIYDSGRSQILHGTHYKRLLSFSKEKGYAAHLARIALIECAFRLVTYTGADEDKAFRTMPEAPKAP